MELIANMILIQKPVKGNVDILTWHSLMNENEQDKSIS